MGIRILVIGSNGQLGNEIYKCLSSGESEIGLIPVEYKNCILHGVDIDSLDITDSKAVESYFGSNGYDLVINCASLTNVDGCETDYESAFKINALGAKSIAVACNKQGAKLIHLSTDYVFDGKGSVEDNGNTIPYCEWDLCNPINIYGKSKLMSEKFVAEFCSKNFMIRTSWLYGYRGSNFVKTILSLGREKEVINVVNDQRGNPTNASDLVHHILKIALTEEYGIYHCSGNEVCSWYELASEVIRLSGIKCEVSPCTTDAFPRLAKRPAYSAMNNLRLRCTIGDEMRPWKIALKSFMRLLGREQNVRK